MVEQIDSRNVIIRKRGSSYTWAAIQCLLTRQIQGYSIDLFSSFCYWSMFDLALRLFWICLAFIKIAWWHVYKYTTKGFLGCKSDPV